MPGSRPRRRRCAPWTAAPRSWRSPRRSVSSNASEYRTCFASAAATERTRHVSSADCARSRACNDLPASRMSGPAPRSLDERRERAAPPTPSRISPNGQWPVAKSTSANTSSDDRDAEQELRRRDAEPARLRLPVRRAASRGAARARARSRRRRRRGPRRTPGRTGRARAPRRRSSGRAQCLERMRSCRASARGSSACNASAARRRSGPTSER